MTDFAILCWTFHIDHELESALKIREIRKTSSRQHPPLCAKCIFSYTEQGRSNTTAYKDELCFFILLVITFFFSNTSSLPGKFKILAQQGQETINCLYTSFIGYLLQDEIKTYKEYVSYSFKNGMKPCWHTVSWTEPHLSDKCHKRSKWKSLVQSSRPTLLPCWSLQSVLEKVISDSQL